MLRLGANLIVHTPPGEVGALVTTAAAVAVRSLKESDAGEHDLQLTVVAIECDHPDFSRWQEGLPDAMFVPTEVVSYPRARNMAYEAAGYMDPSWDVFLEFDSDNVFPARWFEPLWDVMQRDARAGLVSPGIIMSTHWKPREEPCLHVDYATQSYDEIRRAVDEKARDCVGIFGGRTGCTRCPPVVRRPECMRQVGLYDEGYVSSLWNDWDDFMQVIHGDWAVVTCLDAFAFHWTAWEKVLLKGWQGGDLTADEIANKERFFGKWAEARQIVRMYTQLRGQLYRRAAPEGETRR